MDCYSYLLVEYVIHMHLIKVESEREIFIQLNLSFQQNVHNW